jgi:hypothetical protein
MTTSSIMEILVYFYMFLEIYVFVYSQELRVRSHYEYFARLAQVNCTEMEEELNTLLSPSENITNLVQLVQPNQVNFSELDETAEGLFAELQQELGIEEISNFDNDTDFEIFYQPVMEQDFDFTLSHEYQYEYVEEDLGDCIQISDIEEEEAIVPTGFESFASAKISDCVEGPQQWVVSIVGREESYIHISDGKRLWVNVGEKASKLRNGNILILDVIRNGIDITVENLFRLETNLSEEYAIPDEEQYLFDERIAI